MACIQTYLGCQQAWVKCHISGPELAPQKQMWEEEEEGLEEGPSKQMQGGQVRRLRGWEGEEGVELTPLLQDIRSTMEEQTWLVGKQEGGILEVMGEEETMK